MAKNKKINMMLWTAGSLAGGLFITLLVNSRNKRNSERNTPPFISGITQKSQRIGKGLTQLHHSLKQELKGSTPDLYKATEHIIFSGAERTR